ncbi:CaiB/BaiF CoA transferase family protein [Streptomyces gilvus]|uniref:CaiB/BaiF CoA transferase family protein n=1 Tax=Streptomyces gilvus TaxID=2920937 RepID=UPI001F0F5E20|nr:CaiB/BaiF CoA-transferase family protein [Streptomyces sp. CME 23]MCH5677596.1 CoA transferase [Streptomyces sp. CME 23]
MKMDSTAPSGGATGPLSGLRVLELGGIGPGPFAAMLLADLGADVVRVDRADRPTIFPGTPRQNLLHRGKRSVDIDLKSPQGLASARALVARADVLVEGFRPGVAERLGLGPSECLGLNTALVYGRMTGWGQTGPLAATAGHDLNYIGVTGALHAIGAAGGPPQIPLNLLGDFAGGGTYLVIGVLAALREAARTGHGQVVDAAITDGVCHLLAGTHARVASGTWADERGVNLLDGGAPFYSVYETSDGRHMAVGAIEPQFYRAFVAALGVPADPARQNDRSTWPALRERIAAAFRSRTQSEWTEVFAGTDSCVTPVRSLFEAVSDPQIAARGSVVVADGMLQPGRAPRFSAHDDTRPATAPEPGEHTADVFRDWLGACADHRDQGSGLPQSRTRG